MDQTTGAVLCHCCFARQLQHHLWIHFNLQNQPPGGQKKLKNTLPPLLKKKKPRNTHQNTLSKAETSRYQYIFNGEGGEGKLANELKKDKSLLHRLKKKSKLFQCQSILNPRKIFGDILNKYFTRKMRGKSIKNHMQF